MRQPGTHAAGSASAVNPGNGCPVATVESCAPATTAPCPWSSRRNSIRDAVEPGRRSTWASHWVACGCRRDVSSSRGWSSGSAMNDPARLKSVLPCDRAVEIVHEAEPPRGNPGSPGSASCRRPARASRSRIVTLAKLLKERASRPSPTAFDEQRGASLEVSLRCGRSPNAREMRLPVIRLSPLREGSVCSSAWRRAGFVSRVVITTSSTYSSATARGAPGQGSSRRPPRRSRAKRVGHLPTVAGDKPRRRATVLLFYAAAQTSMLRARRAACGAVRDRRASEPRCCRSDSVRTMANAGLPVRICHFLLGQNGVADTMPLLS